MSHQTIPELFEKYTQLAKLLPKQPSDEDMLILYGLYKQSKFGNCDTPKPNSIFNYKEKLKWEAWYSYKGMETETAMKYYIKKVQELYK